MPFTTLIRQGGMATLHSVGTRERGLINTQWLGLSGSEDEFIPPSVVNDGRPTWGAGWAGLAGWEQGGTCSELAG